MEFLKHGSVKDIFTDSKDLIFQFQDTISVFDVGRIPNTLIPYKGETLCRTSAYMFGIAEELGIKNHFKELISPNQMRVCKFNIVENFSKTNTSTLGCMIPLEFVSRYYISGSLWRRLENQKIKPEQIGFPKDHKPFYGEKLPKPLFEVYTKFEEKDRLLTKEEAIKISGLTEAEYQYIQLLIKMLDEKINSLAEERGIIHVDGKKEFAKDSKGNIVLQDTFGTADEDRWWYTYDYKNAIKNNKRPIERSKEFARQYYIDIGYKTELDEARAKNLPDPEAPPLPPEIIQQISTIYIDLFEKITGENI